MSAAAIRLCSTFFLDDPNGGHVRTVVSKPHGDPPEVVVVSFTTWKAWKDQSCVVEPGDHPSVPNRSVMSFERAAVGERRGAGTAEGPRPAAPACAPFPPN